MIGSLYTGISGLNANAAAMNIIGDNIANVNTTGFKSSKASFADVLNGITGNEAGQGVIITGQNTDWTQGAPETTGNATDLAISGKGMFVVRDSAGAAYYTRAGNFRFDNAGNLINNEGLIIQGYEIDPATGAVGGIGNITITSGNCPPFATDKMSVNLNLNADDTNGLDESVGSTLTVNCTEFDSDIKFTAVSGGVVGNDISITYVSTASQPLSIDVVGNAITVNLETDAANAITSTASEIAAAINDKKEAAALVTAKVDVIGAGLVNVPAPASANLSGGGGGAALTVYCANANSDITYTAVSGGTAGNNISIEYVDLGLANQPLGIVVDDSNPDDITITVNLATDDTLAITSTASDIAAAISTNTDAALLVSASAEGDGAGIVDASFSTNLTGGVYVKDNTPDTYSSTITAYDSKGSAVDVTVQYTCVGQGRWVWDVSLSDGFSSSTGVISFDENGKLSYPSANPTINITSLSNGAEDFEIEWDLVSNDNFTGYAFSSSTSFQSQNGYATGMLQSVTVDDEGFVVKEYSNGQLIPGYRITLADFSSYAGLTRIGGNLYSESRASGQPIIGTPGSGSLGSINSSSLETSNVDLATEFVRMITTQRAFQANSRVITSSDEILQELINLKR